MSDLAFQYIGYGCVFLAALRVADVVTHVLLGVFLKALSLDSYYYFAVDVMSRERSPSGYTIFTGTKNDD